ncbi:prolyl-tRNA synthetase family protein [Cryptosporidium serpentis]
MNYNELIIRLKQLSINYDAFKHVATPNMETMINTLGKESEETNTLFAKNLVLKPKNKDILYLITAYHDTNTKMKNLGPILGCSSGNLRFADENILYSKLGVFAGSVTPLALSNENCANVEVFFDEKLRGCKVFVHPLTNTESFSIFTDDLVRFVESCGKSVNWFNIEDNIMNKEATPQKIVSPQSGENLLGITANKETCFAEWYSQVILRSEMVDYYDVSGCYILRPWSYFIWETIKSKFDNKIKNHGIQNSYFPIFVTKQKLETEKNHVEGFSPEVAWVTKSGESDLAEPIAIRPTSETIIYPYYAKWIRSHRDLPLKLNQWTSVVRWEFKQPTPFIRTREFLWQEGHTAHVTNEEATEMVRTILDDYADIYQDLLAVPIIKGIKSESEKFAGANETMTIEGFIPENGRAIQAATSHNLGQNFSRMFGIEFEDEKGTKQFVHQTSWGLTTRSIGVMIMTHGDNNGIILPPKVAPIQVVIIPIVFKSSITEEQKIMCEEVAKLLKEKEIRVHIDDRSNYTPGWKYNHWEVKGVCIRAEIGPKDIESKSVRIVIRDNRKKKDISISCLQDEIPKLLEDLQKRLYNSAKEKFYSSIVQIKDFNEVMPLLNKKKLVLAPWCESVECEEDIKKETTNLSIQMNNQNFTDSLGLTGAMKSLCIPLEQPLLEENTKCFFCKKFAKSFTIFGRSY